MISILIPVYEESCIHLVNDLREQAKKLSEDYEILVFDDCSPTRREDNRPLASMRGVFYHELSANVGRSAIRNLLADRAKGDKLLFVDCDSKVVREDFLEKYLNEADTADVLIGGTVYCPKSKVPKGCELHWKYGTQVECNKTGKKTDTFQANNFFIKKVVFEKVKFDERIKGYGHEDTIFGIELKKAGFAIRNIDNPIEHSGLKNFKNFIASTETAVRNMRKIMQNSEFSNSVGDIRLIKAYKKLGAFGLRGLYSRLFKITKPSVLSLLRSDNPNLRLLDLYKLGVFCERDKA